MYGRKKMLKLLKFYADWCQPCSALSKTIQKSFSEHPLIKSMQEVNIDEDESLPVQYKVRSIPTLIIVDDMGKEIRRESGNIQREKLQEFLG